MKIVGTSVDPFEGISKLRYLDRALFEAAILAKGDLLCECYFKPFLGGSMDFMSDLLVHRNPEMVGDKYDFDSLPGVYCFASPFVLRRLLQLKNSGILVTEARNKYNAGTFCDDEDGI